MKRTDIGKTRVRSSVVGGVACHNPRRVFVVEIGARFLWWRYWRYLASFTEMSDAFEYRLDYDKGEKIH